MRTLLVVVLGLGGVGAQLFGCATDACRVDGDCFAGQACQAGQCIAQSGASAEPSGCDVIADCGSGVDHSGCIGCALATECQAQMQECYELTDCVHFMAAVEACSGSSPGEVDTVCFHSAVELHPEGFAIYNKAALCVYCNACVSSCPEYSEDCR